MSSQAPSRDRSEVWWLALLMAAGFFVAVVSHYVMGFYRGMPYPYNTFLWIAADRPGPAIVPSSGIIGVHYFGDLETTLIQSGHSSPYLDPSIFPSNYLPFTHVLLKPVSWLPYSLALALYFLVTTVGILWLLAVQLRDIDLPLRLLAVGIIGLLNYPFLIMLDRGNVEGLALLLLAAAGLSARRGAWTRSAVLIGAAAAMKGYPLFLVLVLVGARRYRDAAVAIATAASLTLVSLMTFSGGFRDNVHVMLQQISGFNAVAGETGVRYGGSLTGLASAAAHTAPSLSWLPGAVTPVSLSVVIVAAIAVIFGRLLLWQSWAVVTGLTILIPSVAYDYRLILLMVPLLILLREPGGLLRWPSVLVLGLLFVPKGLPVLYGEVKLSVIVNPLLLLLLVLGLSAAGFLQPPFRPEGAAHVPE